MCFLKVNFNDLFLFFFWGGGGGGGKGGGEYGCSL